MNASTPQSTKLTSGIQLVASAIVVAAANITTNQLSGKVSQSATIAILLILVIIITKLLESAAKNLFDNSALFRRLVLGEDYIEGCWLHRVYDAGDPGRLASFAIIYLACGNNSILTLTARRITWMDLILHHFLQRQPYIKMEDLEVYTMASKQQRQQVT
jgi:hypothetical protein